MKRHKYAGDAVETLKCARVWSDDKCIRSSVLILKQAGEKIRRNTRTKYRKSKRKEQRQKTSKAKFKTYQGGI